MKEIIFLIMILLSGGAAAEDGYKPMRMEQSVQFTDAERRRYAEIGPQLYGGRPIRDQELRPSVYIGNCTATIIGPETIITAGHCRSTGSSVSFTYDRVRYSGRCDRHPDYSQNGWLNNDFALCKFSPKIEMPVWGTLEEVEEPGVGDKVVMQGYGRGSDGVLNVGEAVIQRVNYMDLITQGRVYLGGGDSGGALFKHTTDYVNGPFVIVGINSRGGGNTSLFNRTLLDRSRTWFKAWAAENETEVCGVNTACGEAPDPDACPVEKSIVAWVEADLTSAKGILQACLDAQ